MKLSIVLSIQPAQFQAVPFKGDLEQNLRQIAALGYDGVELAIRDPKLVDPDQLESLVNSFNLAVPAIGTGQAWGEEGLSFTDPDEQVRKAAIERIKAHFPCAARFGALVIIGLIRGVVRPGVDPGQAMDWLLEALQECTEAARPYNLRLALEPINHTETSLINTAAQGLELVERLGVDFFGLLLDTYHMSIEEADIETSIRTSGSHIFHFHVADSNRWQPGAGLLDFRSILRTLDSTGYSGWISGEFLPSPDAGTAAEKNIAFLRGLGERGRNPSR